MKLKFLTAVFACVFALGSVVYISSCKKDTCKDVQCLNNGVCDEGTCDCVNGFTGDRCQIAPPDPCEDVVCQNGGTCIDGTCECATGYEGTNCETEVRSKFIGTYLVNGSVNCPVTGNGTVSGMTLTVQSSASGIAKVLLQFGGVSLTATVSGSTLTIDPATLNGYTYTGNGSLTSNVISLSINEADPNVPETCVYSLSGPKQ